MAEIRETHTVVDEVPVERRTGIEDDYPPVVYERRGLSGGAIAALVIAGIAAAILITFLILNNQQRDHDQEMALERARADAAQRAAAQSPTPTQPPQQPPVVVMQPSQPTVVPVPVPSQSAPAAAPSTSAPSSVSVEVDVTTKLLDDADLRTHPIDVKVNNGTATLSGELPSEEMKAKAERVAMSVKGVRRVKNNITVKSD
ncbi:MAG: hypothetical protein V7641_5045 [Blastocatellia bacterium]